MDWWDVRGPESATAPSSQMSLPSRLMYVRNESLASSADSAHAPARPSATCFRWSAESGVDPPSAAVRSALSSGSHAVASGVDATAASYASSSSEELITSWVFV